MSSSEFHHYTRDEFLAEFYPDPADKAAIAAGMKQLRAEQRAFRLAEMRRRLGITQAQVAARMGITQGRVSAIEHAKPGTTELRTLAAYVEALGGRLEIIADFGDQRLASSNPAPKRPDLISIGHLQDPVHPRAREPASSRSGQPQPDNRTPRRDKPPRNRADHRRPRAESICSSIR
jgi:transcriptional regulator with XRE-family HTH domain